MRLGLSNGFRKITEAVKKPFSASSKLAVVQRIAIALLMVSVIWLAIHEIYYKKPEVAPERIVEIDDKRFRDVTGEINKNNQVEEDIPSVNQQITDYEKQLESRHATYEDYLNLAQLYVQAGDKTKAIDNYEKAKKTADPKMENYQSFIESTDNIIKQLKA